MEKTKKKICTWCEGTLDNEEIESPKLSKDKEVVCDDCYDIEYRFICPLCGENNDESETVEEGYFYMITEPRNGNYVIGEDLERGVYQIIKFPFFADGIIEGHYYSTAFKKVRKLTKEELKIIKEENFHDGIVCKGCSVKKK